MKWLNGIFRFLLNPRARLEGLPVSVGTESFAGEAPGGKRTSIRVKDILFNFPLVLGSLIVLGLFIMVLFGPVWAPQNPYITGRHITPHYDPETEIFIRPPLPPSEDFPLGTNRWGTDLLSLLMHGARNTLIAAVFITLSRVILGGVFGALAGWNKGKSIDRVVMSLIGVTTSIPMLISSTILIYALDIRRGLPVFIAALTVIGWTEIAQYVRSQFLVLREMPYIEGAYALGSKNLAIAIRHCLPNILPQLLVITFLEMGAVLMLLGELGFIGVYIGGGHMVGLFQLMAPTQYFTMNEVPEWGAMLAEGFRWLRSKPFVVLPPAGALFISIIGFNSLGEGFRQLIEDHSINTSFLLRKRTLVVIAGILAASAVIINNTGAAPWYTKVASAFSTDSAYQHISTLAEMDGRSLTQPGGAEAADYIEERFIEYGFDPGWKKDSYRYMIPSYFVEPLAQPEFNLLDSDGNIIQEFSHQVDFGYMTAGHGGEGELTLPLTYFDFTEDIPQNWEVLAGLDLTGRIVLLKRDGAPADFASEAMLHGANGILWIAGEGRDDIRSQNLWMDEGKEYLRPPGIPIFRIRPHVASQLLTQAGTNLETIFAESDDITQGGEGWFSRELDVTVQMSLALTPPEAIEIPCILAFRSGYDLGLASSMMIFFTTYDGLGTDLNGVVYPGANHNASGVGIMLEIARLWNAEELDPRRSIMFVAWPSQLGIEYAGDFFERGFNFRHLVTNNPYENVRPEVMVQLDFAAAGGETMIVHPHSTHRLRELLLETALLTETKLEEKIDSPDFTSDIVTKRLEWFSIRWDESGISPLEDGIDEIDREKIEEIGKLMSLALINLVREADY